MPPVHPRDHDNILKRLLIQVSAFNLGLLMRTLFDVGTPRTLQRRAVARLRGLWELLRLPRSAPGHASLI